MRQIFIFLLAITCFQSFGQNNLLDTSTWAVGSGSVIGFSKNGTDAENIREMGISPHGDNVVLWEAIPDASNDGDGGWNGSYFNIDHTKTYRFSVWIKKTNSHDGRTYFGLKVNNNSGSNASLRLDGTLNTNPYFWWDDLPQLNTWYLLVGFIHDSSYSGLTVQGGIYDGETGNLVSNIGEGFKFSSDATKMLHRSYLYYDTNTAMGKPSFFMV